MPQGQDDAFRDISEQVRVEAALRAREAQLQAIIESLPADVFAIGADGRYFLQNSLSRQRWGDIMRKRPQDVAPTEEDAAIWEDNNRRAFAGETVRGEVALHVKREVRWFYNVITPIRVNGAIDGILGMNLDITDRKRMERRLEAWHRDLEDEVRERTRELEDVTCKLREELSERKRLERQLATLSGAERQGIGRELHDTLGQQLTGIAFLASALRRRLAKTGSDEADTAARLCGLLQEALTQLRTVVKGVTPVEICEEGLSLALRDLARQTRTIYGVACRYEAEHAVNVSDHTAATELFLIAREAVTNAVKHAGPEAIGIRLARTREGVVLTVEDDGCGLPPEGDRRTGMGLSIMEYRAGAVGASLTVEPAEGGGTRVSCVLPAGVRSGTS